LSVLLLVSDIVHGILPFQTFRSSDDENLFGSHISTLAFTVWLPKTVSLFRDLISLDGHSFFRYNAKRLFQSIGATHLVSGINFDLSTGLRCFEIYLNQISSVYLKLFGHVASSTLCLTLSDLLTKFYHHKISSDILECFITSKSFYSYRKTSSLSGFLLKVFSAFYIQLSDLFAHIRVRKHLSHWQMFFSGNLNRSGM